MSSDRPRRGRRRGDLTAATIAQLAGVSTPTVSRVLNGRPGVAPETRRRVEAVLHEHSYRRPDPVAPATTVEVVFYAQGSHMAMEFMRGVDGVARQHDLAVGFTEATDRTTTGRTWVERLLARRPMGVIVVYSDFTPHQTAQLATSGIPLVALDPIGEPSHTVPIVAATNWSGGTTATRYLLELGHRRIAVIGGPPSYLGARARLEGCRAALDQAGVPVDQQMMRTGRFIFDDGRRLGRELLSLPEPPTAIICGNDAQALGVYAAAWQLGLQIPRDLSVVGFDDIEQAGHCCPPMTTMRQPFDAMGAAAATMVVTLAAGHALATTRIELATTLVVRDSTAPPAA
jgi:LacI family xylobiose transport system transcriptional regulator